MFTGTTDAVSAAVAMQQAAVRLGRSVHSRLPGLAEALRRPAVGVDIELRLETVGPAPHTN